MPASYEPVRENLDVTLPPRPFLAPYAPTIAKAYHPVSPLSPAFNVGLTGAGVGLFVSAIKNSLETHNKGAMGVFSRTGWIIGYFGESPFALRMPFELRVRATLSCSRADPARAAPSNSGY